MKELYYENHPVSVDRKKLLISKGYKIIDARFAPNDWIDPLKPKRKPKAKAPSKEI